MYKVSYFHSKKDVRKTVCFDEGANRHSIDTLTKLYTVNA